MIGGADSERRQQFVLRHLAERRAATDGEAERLRVELAELTHREAALRDEIGALDTILAAIPEPRKESEAPSLFGPARPTPSPQPPAPAIRRRRRKGSRREQMLPALRAKFGPATFTTEDVTDMILAAEPGDRRRAYFAAWSLVRDLAEDGIVVVVAEEGTGPRKKRTYRLSDQT